MSAPLPVTPNRKPRPRPLHLGVSPINLNGLPPHQSDESPSQKIVPQLAELSLAHEKNKLDLKPQDIEILQELGAGNGGTVHKVLHRPSNTIMARKVISIPQTDKSVRKQIMRELQIMHKCNSPYIVSFYGAFFDGGDISICMEFMNLGSLDNIYKEIGPIPEDVVGKVTNALLAGLVYLYKQHRIIHRDVKPSNILLDSEGHIKIADFGVSGQLIDSMAMADTFVGTSAYMSPERIRGAKYSVQSDVWSIGITVMELVLGKFPFPPEGKPLSVFELLEYTINEPAPSLPPGQFSRELEGFITRCLIKDPAARPTPSQLMNDPFCKKAAEMPVDIKEWAKKIQEAR